MRQLKRAHYPRLSLIAFRGQLAASMISCLMMMMTCRGQRLGETPGTIKLRHYRTIVLSKFGSSNAMRRLRDSIFSAPRSYLPPKTEVAPLVRISANARRRKSGIESRVSAIRVAASLRSLGDLVLQVAGLMIAAELAQRRLVQLSNQRRWGVPGSWTSCSAGPPRRARSARRARRHDNLCAWQ